MLITFVIGLGALLTADAAPEFDCFLPGGEATAGLGGGFGERDQMNPVRSIKSLLLVAGFVFSLVMVAATGVVVSRIYEGMVREDAAQSADSFAALTFNAMFELMSTGWSRRQLEAYLGAIQKSVDDTPRRIDIYRGPKVSARFGEVAQKPFDTAIVRAFAEGLPVREDVGDAVRVIRPLKASDVCLGCHTNAAIGDVLGVIDVQLDISRQIAVHRERFLYALAPMVPLAVVATLLMVLYIQRRLGHSLARLAEDIGSVNKVADLRVLESRPERFGFAEFNLIQREIGQLTERIRGIAVDRDMLEFEIRLLEKFVLTSEVIKDWREYVKRLMLEIDTVMPAYTMFSIFKTGEGSYDLEVFWRYNPTEQTRLCFEGCMRAVLPAAPYFTAGCAVRVAHNVADRSVQLPELSMADIEVKIKSLLVDIPKIGGIVGIGMQPQDEAESSRLLAVQSILATLLNVVGSVKAIDKYTKELEYYATRDPLTNLYNQRVFWELIDSEVHRSARQGNKFSILVIDADNFKSVNDTYGHGVGDILLQTMVDGIRQAIREDDLLSRYGGDEFVAILPDSDQDTAYRVASRIIDKLASVTMDAPDGGHITTSVSVGLATYPDHAVDSRNLFLFGDNMMYRAKADGKNRIIMPTADDVIDVFRTLGEKSMLVLDAIERRSVVPFYQPIVKARNGEVEAVEVLSRIRLDDGSFMAADEYVEIAEKMGVMHRLDFIQLEKALAAVEETGYTGYLFINLSPKALVLHDFIDVTRQIVSRFKVDRSRLVFEITERETIKNMALLDRFVANLRAEGFKLAIDDFGSGFSSFHYIKRFPIDFLKIEGDFIRGLRNNEKDRMLVRSIVSLAQDMGIRTVAEYVEDQPTLNQVFAHGIDLAQGYHICRPDVSLARALQANLRVHPGLRLAASRV